MCGGFDNAAYLGTGRHMDVYRRGRGYGSNGDAVLLDFETEEVRIYLGVDKKIVTGEKNTDVHCQMKK